MSAAPGRAALGRNVVFVSPTAVIKLGPPMWAGEMAREATALSAIAGRLPAATPTLLAIGALDRWGTWCKRRCHARIRSAPLNLSS